MLLLIGTCLLTAQAEEAEEMELLSPEELTLRANVGSASHFELRESEILTDYGFKDRDALSTSSAGHVKVIAFEVSGKIP